MLNLNQIKGMPSIIIGHRLLLRRFLRLQWISVPGDIGPLQRHK